jgi:hypothetical protein
MSLDCSSTSFLALVFSFFDDSNEAVDMDTHMSIYYKGCAELKFRRNIRTATTSHPGVGEISE